jgi:chromosome segregation protein
MYLKSLELIGFKSFSKKAGLQFTTPITGIVGPNGSGKSNVAEAFRFVLGEQSIKSLRGKRGEDLIWNGGDESVRANRASVKLVFDNSRRIFKDIDFDEVSVERIVHRDNVNEYLINNSQVRLKDVVELLAGAHIGATGHHIISQGEADRILSASIRERREMIEDALGLKLYQWKKLESLRKLERTEENMKQVESLRREIAPHIRFLKKQVEKVEKAEQLKQELIQVYKEYFAFEGAYIDSEKRHYEQALIGPKAELETLDKALDKARQTLTESKNKDEKSDEVIMLETKIANIRGEKDILVRELGRLEGELSANRRTLEKEKGKLKSQEMSTVYLKDVETVISEIETIEKVGTIEQVFNNILNVLRSFVSKHKGKSDSAMIADIEKEISTLENDKSACERKLAGIIAEEREIHAKYESVKTIIEKEKDTSREAEKEVFRIIGRQNEVRASVNELSTKYNQILFEEDNYKKELTEAGILVGRMAVNFKEIIIPERFDFRNSEFRNAQMSKLKQIEKIKVRLEDAGSSGGSDILKEYKDAEERDTFLQREIADLEKAKDELNKLISDLDARIDLEFKTGIFKINAEFNKYFALMFGGGKAELSVVREIKRKKRSDVEELGSMLSEDNTTLPDDKEETEEGQEGLEVSVSLPRKKVKSLVMLSGGERALTSIALLFAISQVNPPPFIILDETDAALDEANSKKYGDMIENLSVHSQLILITHNRETMSRAGALYGVTMGGDGASRLLSIVFEEAVKVAK